jgi:hypothetical protein
MSIIHPSSADLRAAADQARRLADALDRLAADGQPSPADVAGAPVLDAWLLARRAAPALVGRVRGHPSVGEGRLTLTSELFAIDPNPAKRWARTWSRLYRLGSPNLDDAMSSRRGRLQ